jgi:formylglycine-generating enzyme required for sulfatase activity
VLLPRPGKRAAFYHFTFQDFLAAQLIVEREDDLAVFFRRRAAWAEWRSTLSFVFGSLMARHTLPDKGIRLLQQLIEPLTLDELPLMLVVSDCLEILAGQQVGLQQDHVAKFRQLCRDGITREVELEPRVELGLALGRLGDPRIVEDLRDHDDERAWVEIKAGTYTVGGGGSFIGIEPLKQQKFRVAEPFKMTRYPVTNSQFAVFIEAGGYEDRQWWSEEGWKWREEQSVKEPAWWRDAKWNGPNQPVVGVSFWEAEAFSKWAGGRLPGECEWEAAARGPQGYEYSWGSSWEDGVYNTSELRLRKTTPVGLFPRSRSAAFGLEDAVGNVWEWCADEVESTLFSGVCRVLRGGSWGNDRASAGCGYRDGWHPGGRYNFCGFRMCCVFSPGLSSS